MLVKSKIVHRAAEALKFGGLCQLQEIHEKYVEKNLKF